MESKEVKGEQVTEPYLVPNLLSGASIGTWQEDYPLREVDFERIKHGKPITFVWAHSFLLTSFGFGLSLIAKGYSDMALIKQGEWIALAVGLLFSVVMYLIGFLMPNKRKETMNRIEEHFKKAPTSRQAFREKLR
jgi:hypothetical protein